MYDPTGIRIFVKLPNGKTRPMQVPQDATGEELLRALHRLGALGDGEPDEFEAYAKKKLAEGRNLFETRFAPGDLVEIVPKPSRTDRYQFLDEAEPGK